MSAGDAAALSPPAAPAPTIIGLIEAMAQLESGLLFVSGWSRGRPEQGAAVDIWSENATSAARWWAMWSDRPDVGPMTGFCGVIEGDLREGQLGLVMLADGTALALYDEARTVPPAHARALIRAALSGTAGKDIGRLRDVAEGYDGTDTLAASGLPVRVGVDDCVRMDGGAVLVRGWMFDPEELVETVTVAGEGVSSPIDHGWIGIKRPDVAEALAADGRLGVYAPPHQTLGFSALAMTSGPADGLHLRLRMATGPLHVPLTPRDGDDAQLLGQYVRALNPAAAGTKAIIETQVAPLLARTEPRMPLLATAEETVDPVEGLSIVVGCAGDCADIPALMQVMAHASGLSTFPVIFAGDRHELRAHADEIAERALFLGLEVALAPCRGARDALLAATAGVHLARTTRVLVTTCGALPYVLEAAPDATSEVLTLGHDVGEPPAHHAAIVVDRQEFLDVGGFAAARLTSAGRWAALLGRLRRRRGGTIGARALAGDLPASRRLDDHDRLLLLADRLAEDLSSGTEGS